MLGHLPELLIVLVIGLIAFGPEKMPEVAASAGKMVREFREVMDTAMHPHEHESSDDFATYYTDSLQRSGEDAPETGSVDAFQRHLEEYEQQNPQERDLTVPAVDEPPSGQPAPDEASPGAHPSLPHD